MCIYEVNLRIPLTIYQEFLNWLKEHIAEMLTFEGFVSCELAKNVESAQHGQVEIVCWYYLRSRDDLESYISRHSERMRAEGKKKFGDQLQASRRVFSTLGV